MAKCPVLEDESQCTDSCSNIKDLTMEAADKIASMCLPASRQTCESESKIKGTTKNDI